MAVRYQQGGGGGYNPLGILGTLLSFVPGMQPVGMGIGALGAAIDGNPMGAITGLVGMGKQNAPQAPQPPAPQPNWGAPDYNQMWQDFNKNRGMY